MAKEPTPRTTLAPEAPLPSEAFYASRPTLDLASSRAKAGHSLAYVADQCGITARQLKVLETGIPDENAPALEPSKLASVKECLGKLYGKNYGG